MGNVIDELRVLLDEYGWSSLEFRDLVDFQCSGEVIGFVFGEHSGDMTLYGKTGNSTGIISFWNENDFIGDAEKFEEIFDGLLDYLLRVPRRNWVHELSYVLDWGFQEV